MKPIYTLLALALAGCINPLEGDFGPVEVVPEQDSCAVKVREFDGVTGEVRIYYEMRPCDGEDHDVVFLDKWRW